MIKAHFAVSGLLLAMAFLGGISQARAGNGRSADTTTVSGVVDGLGSEPGSITASFSSEILTAHSTEADDRLKRADAHFNSGRQMYFEGNLTAARKEFDASVDVLLSAPDSLPDHRRIEHRLDEICDLIYRFDVEKLGAGQAGADEVVFDRAPIDEISHMTFGVDPNLAPKLSSELKQTASGIPLELADPVLSYVHYFSTERGRGVLLAGLRRSGKYKALIQRVFAEEDVPEELIFLAQAESGFLPRAVSYKQAVGMWQFIEGTGSIYSLGRSSSVDDRLDPEKATRAAAKYLKDLYSHYGDWYLAMAAYNCGAGAVDRAIERTGYADFWELLKRHALPHETANYVPIILAMTIMAKNPQDYGLENVDMDAAVEYDSIALTASTNLNLIADATMQPLSVIRDLNPSLLRSLAPAGFEIHLPRGAADSARIALESVPAESRTAWRLHHVEAGDTLEAIARAYHLSADRIAAVNPAGDSLEAGDVLFIPASFHDEGETRHVRARSMANRAAMGRVFRSDKKRATQHVSVQRGSHIVASRRLSPSTLHRKAAIRTASLTH